MRLFETQNLEEQTIWSHISPVVGEEPLFNSLRVGTDAHLSLEIDKEWVRDAPPQMNPNIYEIWIALLKHKFDYSIIYLQYLVA